MISSSRGFALRLQAVAKRAAPHAVESSSAWRRGTLEPGEMDRLFDRRVTSRRGYRAPPHRARVLAHGEPALKRDQLEQGDIEPST